MEISYVEHNDIDRQRYNSCIHYALNGRVYGYKWYLDATARSFDILVEGNYESVFPIVTNKNWAGKKTLYMPSFTPSLGLFSVHVLSQKRLQVFYDAIQERCDFVNATFSGPNTRNLNTAWNWNPVYNKILEINGKSYEQIAAEYPERLKVIFQNAQNNNLTLLGNQKLEKVADFMVKYFPNGKILQHPFLRIMYNALHRSWGWTTAIANQKGEYLATCGFIVSHGRTHLIAPTISSEGKKVNALDLLIDAAIRQSSNRQVILDFSQVELAYLDNFELQQERNFSAVKEPKFLGLV